MIELEHSPLGGSAAHRFMTCAGSFLLHRAQLETGEFENIESDYAKLGTAAHELCARSVLEDREPFEFIGEVFGEYRAGWPDGIKLDAAHIYFNECLSIMDRYQRKGWLIVEKTYHLPRIHPLLRGTVDFAFLVDDVIYLRDYKNGEGVGVSATNNRQLLYYAFLLARGDKGCELMHRDTKVSLGIVQPNFYGIFEGPDIWETTLGFVLDWGNTELLPRMNALSVAIDEPFDDDFVPGDHCQFCPVLLDCPKMQRAFTEYADASEDFVTMLTNQELDSLYARRDHARRFMNVLEDTVRARMIAAPGCIKSAKLVEKKVARVWKPGAQAALVEAFGEKAFKPKEILSPASVEKLSSTGKALALEYGYKPESAALTIAPLTDPRPEAKPRNNGTVFEAHSLAPAEAGW